jgi:glycolate oxidase iron-sulfur subunit
MLFGKLGKKLQGLVPRRLRPMVEMVPEQIPRRVKLAEFTPAIGTRRGRVGLLSGCAQQVLAPEINLAAQRLLARNGYDVVLPRGQVCCGALHWHIGEDQRAQQFARENLRAFSGDLDAIITTAAGCGSAMHEYPLMLAGTKDEEAGRQLAAKAIDIAAFLDKVGLVPFPQRELPMTIRVAYHDACHLSHGQKVRSPPRELLRQVPGLELVELAETELCCGSAGTYNLDHPETAAALGEQKARQVIDSNAEFLALGNIGCLIQLQNHLVRLGSSVKVVHTVQLLDQACHLTSAERVVNPKECIPVGSSYMAAPPTEK